VDKLINQQTALTVSPALRRPVPQTATAGQAAKPLPVLDAPLSTRISTDVDRRLRLAALVRRMPLGQFLDLVLDQALPPVDQLADQIRGGTSDER
jgi:hypothetical protein